MSERFVDESRRARWGRRALTFTLVPALIVLSPPWLLRTHRHAPTASSKRSSHASPRYGVAAFLVIAVLIALLPGLSRLRFAYHERQVKLQYLQELYRVRLGHLLDAARELLSRREGTQELERQRSAAVAAIQRLDTEHLARLDAVHAEFEALTSPESRPEVVRHRAEAL